MPNLSELDPNVVAAALIVFVVVAVALSRVYWRWRLERWAASEGLRLVSFRGGAFWEGPGKFVRSENKSAFRVEVEDGRGVRRAAWLTFGSTWGLVLGEPLSGVEWER